MIRHLLLAVFVLVGGQVSALSPSERLADPVLEQRARDISAQLRCLVCQNQSIDDSDATLAKDLRRIVRERLTAGNTDAEVKGYLVDRYGEFVLLKPSFSLKNALLWLTPLIAILAGLLLARRQFRRAAAPDVQPQELTDTERSELERVLKERG